MTFFLVIDLVLRIFPFFSHIFRMFTMLNVVYMTISSQEKHNFHSVHAFTHIRQHYFSKYWGDQCMGGPPTSTFGGGGRPPSPPLGLRPWCIGLLLYTGLDAGCRILAHNVLRLLYLCFGIPGLPLPALLMRSYHFVHGLSTCHSVLPVYHTLPLSVSTDCSFGC